MQVMSSGMKTVIYREREEIEIYIERYIDIIFKFCVLLFSLDY